MQHLNPKVVGLILLIIAISAMTFWFAREYFEKNPPAPDAQTQN